MFAHGFVYTAVHLVSSEVVSNTMKNIYESINGINENDIPHITDLLEKLDIKKKIEITESLFIFSILLVILFISKSICEDINISCEYVFFKLVRPLRELVISWTNDWNI